MQNKTSIKVGIVGYTGMVGQEIHRNLHKIQDAEIDICYLQNSTESQGRSSDCDLVFLATKDDISMVMADRLLLEGVRVIDMSGAFRLNQCDFEKWYRLKHLCPQRLEEAVYGMPALYKKEIANAQLIANPGCYATSVIIPLYAVKNLVEGEATIVSTSGNSGARKSAEQVENDIAYSYGRKHKHVPEMERYTGLRVNFTPIVLRSVFKGINTNIRIRLKKELAALSPESAQERLELAFQAIYVPDDLVYIVRDGQEQYGTAYVNDTNKIAVKIRVEEGYAYINSCLDNLGKGAATQAIENMRIMFQLPRQYEVKADM